jgi:hypothetical protein
MMANWSFIFQEIAAAVRDKEDRSEGFFFGADTGGANVPNRLISVL